MQPRALPALHGSRPSYGPILVALAIHALLLFGSAGNLAAQAVASEGVVTVAVGQSTLITPPVAVQRVSVGDPSIADPVMISPRELLVNGRTLGTTTLIVWDVAGGRRTYTIQVTVDATALQSTLQALFPGERVRVTVSGSMVILSGTVSEGRIGRQALELARGTGAQVIDNLQMPPAQQIMLQVRIAEVSRNAIREFGTHLRALNPDDITGDEDWGFESISDGLLRLFIGNPVLGPAGIEAIFRALRTTGEVRMLAEPNLIAVEGAEASFLAGGEFPFPILQAGAQAGAVTIQWREFGVRLNFTPQITAAGNIRLQVAPEVSSLDFASGLTVGGFAIPSLLTRRAATEIELRAGQTFAIAGLLDNTTMASVTRIPLLGDLPIIGELFRTRLRRQTRTELMVLVTPHLVSPQDVPPPVPTGEPETWRWDGHLRQPPSQTRPQ
jgi:pilus assembly protein CpaC